MGAPSEVLVSGAGLTKPYQALSMSLTKPYQGPGTRDQMDDVTQIGDSMIKMDVRMNQMGVIMKQMEVRMNQRSISMWRRCRGTRQEKL